MKTTFGSRAALAALALAACSSRDNRLATVEVPRPDQTIAGNISPRSYEVPAGHGAEIRRLFKSNGGAMSYPIAVVSAQGTQTQFVQPQPVFLGENRFVVALPEQHHAALAQVLSEMKAAGAPTATESYEMTYWVVEATPADADEIAPDLGEVSETLGKLGALGKRKFKLIDRVGGRVTDGEDATMKSLRTEVYQTMVGDPNGLQVHVELQQNTDDKHGPQLRTTLRLKPGQPAVLGDASLSAPVATVNGLVLYVVRARRVD